MLRDDRIERVAIFDEADRPLHTADVFREREERRLRARVSSTVAQRIDRRGFAIGRGIPANVVPGSPDPSFDFSVVHSLTLAHPSARRRGIETCAAQFAPRRVTMAT